MSCVLLGYARTPSYKCASVVPQTRLHSPVRVKSWALDLCKCRVVDVQHMRVSDTSSALPSERWDNNCDVVQRAGQEKWSKESLTLPDSARRQWRHVDWDVHHLFWLTLSWRSIVISPSEFLVGAINVRADIETNLSAHSLTHSHTCACVCVCASHESSISIALCWCSWRVWLYLFGERGAAHF